MSNRRTALSVVTVALTIMFGFSSGLPISPSVGRAQSGGPIHIQYNDFATTAGLVLNGTTAQSGNVLRLTPAAQFSAGSIFSVACTLGGRTIIASTTLTIGQPTTPIATASTP